MDPFEQSADMRLLELQRKALGMDERPRSAWSGSSSEMHEGIPIEEAPLPQLSGARLLVDLTATPKEKLVPGAVVTLSLAIQNAGDQSAADLRVAVPVPGEATFRDGSLEVDGRPASASYAEALFGEGYLQPELGAGQRLGFIWKISVQRGVSMLVVAPRVTSTNAAVVGSASILLSRAAISKGAALPSEYQTAADVPEQPFYELDAEEALRLDEEIPAPPVETSAQTPMLVMPDIIEEESLPPAPEAAREPPRLYCALDSSSLAMVRKLFSSGSFGQIPHYILQNSLACSIGIAGQDDGLRAHFSQQAGVLSRALLMRKLKSAVNVADFSAGKTGFELPSESQRPPVHPPSALYISLSAADLEFCARSEGARNPLESFIRIRQLAVTLMARHLATPVQPVDRTVEKLLEAYANAARAAINRTFIRAKLDRNFDPFGAADPAADELAHELIEALAAVVNV